MARPTVVGPTTIERVDGMISRGESPPALLVFVDAATSWGGSQFLNSPGSGRYLDYLCQEVVPFVDARYPTGAAMEHRGVCGKSSGGYGAMVIPMLRPGVFGATGSRAERRLRLEGVSRSVRRLRHRVRVHAGPQPTGRARIPFDSVGRPVDEIWSEWLALDPVRMAQNHADALTGMHMIQLDAGHQDQFFLDLGAAAFSAELTRLGI